MVALLGPLRLDPFRTCVAKAIARRFNSTPIRLSSFPPSSPDIVDTNDNDDDGDLVWRRELCVKHTLRTALHSARVRLAVD